MIEKERKSLGWRTWTEAAQYAADRSDWRTSLCNTLCPRYL